MSSNSKLSLWSILIVSLLFCSIALQAQESTGKTTSITGCLQKGVEDGGFFISAPNGKVWELSGKIDAAHLGHKVTVTGHAQHRAKIEEVKLSDTEKQEANGKPFADFQVTSLKMISDTCP